MTVLRRWFDSLWPAAMLLVFLATFRRTSGDASGQRPDVNCDEHHGVAAQALEQCLVLDSHNVEIIVALGDLYAEAGAADRAEAMYRRALGIDPDDGTVHLRLGELLLRRGDFAGAHNEGQAALASQPGSLIAERLIERATAEGHR